MINLAKLGSKFEAKDFEGFQEGINGCARVDSLEFKKVVEVEANVVANVEEVKKDKDALEKEKDLSENEKLNGDDKIEDEVEIPSELKLELDKFNDSVKKIFEHCKNGTDRSKECKEMIEELEKIKFTE